MTRFPSLKSKKMLAILMRKPLYYHITHQAGSHRKLVSVSYPDLCYSYHDKVTLSPDDVRNIMVNKVGLTEQEALNLL
ncbi:MAG: hypothetical protein AB2L14_10515 [Candidatus Xenobiia bacterium LiM19]